MKSASRLDDSHDWRMNATVSPRLMRSGGRSRAVRSRGVSVGKATSFARTGATLETKMRPALASHTGYHSYKGSQSEHGRGGECTRCSRDEKRPSEESPRHNPLAARG